jgi:hypothetical protein
VMVTSDVMESDDPGRSWRHLVLLFLFQAPSLNPGGQGRSRSQPNMLGRSGRLAFNGARLGI